MDTVTPTIDGEWVVRTLHKEMENVHVLLMGHNGHRDLIFRGLKAGAKGYVSRTESASVLVSEIMDIYHGL